VVIACLSLPLGGWRRSIRPLSTPLLPAETSGDACALA
jgi:hypothetical protein